MLPNLLLLAYMSYPPPRTFCRSIRCSSLAGDMQLTVQLLRWYIVYY